MHLKMNIDIPHFLLQVKKCKGEIYYETPEGDRLNLASALSQYVFCAIAGNPELRSTGTVRCQEQDDLLVLSPYLEEKET